jgi:hypothetical protein
MWKTRRVGILAVGRSAAFAVLRRSVICGEPAAMVHPSRRFGGRARGTPISRGSRAGCGREIGPPVQRSSNRPLHVELLQVREGSPRPGDPSSFQYATRDTASLRPLRCRRFRGDAVIRLERFFTELRVDFAQLGSLGDVVFVGCFCKLALHLDYFVEGLCTK